jgi:hypothetical protein
MGEAVRQTLFHKSRSVAQFSDWPSDPDAFAKAREAAQALLDRLKPKTPPTAPEGISKIIRDPEPEMVEEFRNIGASVAHDFYTAYANPGAMPHLETRNVGAMARRLHPPKSEERQP